MVMSDLVFYLVCLGIRLGLCFRGELKALLVHMGLIGFTFSIFL